MYDLIFVWNKDNIKVYDKNKVQIETINANGCKSNYDALRICQDFLDRCGLHDLEYKVYTEVH